MLSDVITTILDKYRFAVNSEINMNQQSKDWLAQRLRYNFSMSSVAELSDTPKYNIKAVCAQTGIRPVTLRAWERRYTLLTPHRTNSNYRLYSERDIAVLRWLKSRVDSGQAISAAVAEYKDLRRNSKWPDTLPVLQQSVAAVSTTTPPALFVSRLFAALINFDEDAADNVLSEAHAVFDLITVCLEIITPCLVRIGESWHRGEILISTEHFASNYLRGRLMTLLHVYPASRSMPRIVIGCAPSERHDIGSLILALMLRREGYRVDFLGTGIPVSDLIDYARAERPALVCLAASTEETTCELAEIQDKLAELRPPIKLGIGGRIFTLHEGLRQQFSHSFLGTTIPEACANIRKIVG